MSIETYSTGQRLFRGVVTALVGAGTGLVAALLFIRYGWVTAWNPIATFTVIGATVGGITGFLFRDYTWKRLLRTVLPFSDWP